MPKDNLAHLPGPQKDIGALGLAQEALDLYSELKAGKVSATDGSARARTLLVVSKFLEQHVRHGPKIEGLLKLG